MEPRYRLVFAGRLVQGTDPEQAIAALVQRFRVREARAREMIRGGGRQVLKHDLDLVRARRYGATLEAVGIATVLEPQGPDGDSALAADLSIQAPFSTTVPEPAPMPGSTPCPKCRAVAVSPVTGVCDACGVVAERYLARLAAEGRAVPGAGASPGPSRPHPALPADPVDGQDGAAGDALCDPYPVPAARGWGWLGDAWSQLRAQPWVWIGALVLFLLVSMAVGLLPVIGGLALGILGPMLTGGLMIGAHAQWGGGRFAIAHLFAGFSQHPGGLALLGLAYLGLSLLLGLAVALALFAGVETLAPEPSVLDLGQDPLAPGMTAPMAPLMLLPVVLGVLLGIPLMMAFLFAPALVAIDGVPVGRALGLSLVGCWRNLLPLAVFGLAALGLGALIVLSLGLALLVVMPLLTLALYHAYRDIYRC